MTSSITHRPDSYGEHAPGRRLVSVWWLVVAIVTLFAAVTTMLFRSYLDTDTAEESNDLRSMQFGVPFNYMSQDQTQDDGHYGEPFPYTGPIGESGVIKTNSGLLLTNLGIFWLVYMAVALAVYAAWRPAASPSRTTR